MAREHAIDQDFLSERGLASCMVCTGGEGSLPTECPGEPMGYYLSQRVYAGTLDYVEGRWQRRLRRGLIIRFNETMALSVPLDAVDPWPRAPRSPLPSPEASA